MKGGATAHSPPTPAVGQLCSNNGVIWNSQGCGSEPRISWAQLTRDSFPGQAPYPPMGTSSACTPEIPSARLPHAAPRQGFLLSAHLNCSPQDSPENRTQKKLVSSSFREGLEMASFIKQEARTKRHVLAFKGMYCTAESVGRHHKVIEDPKERPIQQALELFEGD